MKVVCVVDSITDIKNKINLLSNRFGSNIVYIVKGNLLELFKTFGYTANAVYQKNLAKVMHMLLLKSAVESIVIYYTSLKLDNKLLNEFIHNIGKENKAVNIMPNYNGFEKMCFSVYNTYVKSLFKANDSLISPKLQFIPIEYATTLLSTHIGNRIFEIEPELSKTIYIEDKEISNSAKPKAKFDKFMLLPIIMALAITLSLIVCLAYFKVNFIFIAVFVCLYMLDFVIAIIYKCKTTFDLRFLK
ncbi:MAG: hypothetical protein IKM43_01820 [Clostridia bacterium]|nr:hypothetical protein [Clostridia bacterium]